MRWLGLSACVLAGCYQSLGAGYVHRFAEHGGDGVEGYWQFTFGDDLHEDLIPVYLKSTIAGGGWGARGASVIGVAPSVEMDDWAFFARPGLAWLAIGHEAARREEGTWVGVGLETDVGWRARIGDRNAIEFGLRGGADLSYVGHGSGAFVGLFIGVGWGSDFDVAL